LFLFHHDPAHTDEQLDEMLAKARQVSAAREPSLRVDMAREGLQVEFEVAAREKFARV